MPITFASTSDERIAQSLDRIAQSLERIEQCLNNNQS